MHARSLVLAPSALVLALAGCASDPDDTCVVDRRISLNKLSANKLATNRLAANKLATNKLATNRLAANRLAANRIALNGLLASALPEGPLTSEGLAGTVKPTALADEFVQDVLEYMVSCALEPGQSVEVAVDGDVMVYEGSLGLAPQWGTEGGACDGECQGWVSACLIARTNFLGVTQPISLLGEHENLEPTAEESIAFDVEEATYFGDLFSKTRTLYACVPAGSSGPERTCGDDPSSCAITVLGECDAICDASGCRDPEGVLHAQTITVNTRDPSAACE
jgi:hypothetical protein